VFLDVFLYILSFFQIVIQKSDCYRVLAQVCTAPMLRKSEILVILNSKQNSLCQLAITELFPKGKKIEKQKENYKSAIGSYASD